MDNKLARQRAVRTSKNAVMLLAGTITRMVASFAFVLYSAASLGLDGFGRFSIATHYFELFLSLAATAVGILLTRDLARWPKRQNELSSSAILVSMLLCIVAPMIMIPLAYVFGYSSETISAIAVSCIALFPASVCVVFEAVFVAKERAEFVTAGTAIESVLRIAIGVMLLHYGYGLIELMWLLVVVRILLVAIYWYCLRQMSQPKLVFSRIALRRFVIRWPVFAAENWMATIYTNLDVIVLSILAGEAAVGLYSASWKFVRLGTVVAKSFTTAVFPVMSRMYAESQSSFKRLFRHAVRAMYTLALPGVVAVSVLTERIVDLLYTDEYAQAVPVLRILIWVLLIEFLNPFLSHVLFAQGKQHRSMHVAAISLAVNLIASYFLVIEFGAVGSAIACVLAGSVACFFYLVFAMPKREVMFTLFASTRALASAIAMGIVVYFLRDAAWPIVIFAGILAYTSFLFLFQAIGVRDIQFFKNTFLSRATA